MTTTVMKKRTRMPLPFQFLFCLSFAVVGGNAQSLDSLSKSQRFEMILSESHYKIDADLLNHTKTFYDTLGYDSIVQKYYPSGQLYKQCNYSNGLLHGKAVTFHSNGRLENEKHYCFGECTDSQSIYYDMFGFVELESWKIRYRGRDFLCATRYGYGKLSTVRIYTASERLTIISLLVVRVVLKSQFLCLSQPEKNLSSRHEPHRHTPASNPSFDKRNVRRFLSAFIAIHRPLERRVQTRDVALAAVHQQQQHQGKHHDGDQHFNDFLSPKHTL